MVRHQAQHANSKETIAVVGAGLMGAGIAVRFACGGYLVRLYDVTAKQLSEARDRINALLQELVDAGRIDGGNRLAEQIETTGNLNSLRDAVLVFEAVPERLGLKHEAYRALLPVLDEQAILASNTSGYLPDVLSEPFTPAQRARFLIAHFWNPPHAIPLVEIVPGSSTAAESIAKVRHMVVSAGCEPVVLNQAIPGFIGNRLQFALLREALHIVQSGAASAEEIDVVMKASLGRRYATFGLLEGADIGGLDTLLDVAAHLLPELASGEAAMEVLREYVANGETGVRSGKGFYVWNDERRSRLRAQRIRALRAQPEP